MKIAATFGIKGGVGKTAAAVNLARLAAETGLRTVLWDLDPQAAATFYFRIRPKVKGGAEQVVRRRQPLDDVIKASDYARLDLVPADFSYRNFDLLFDATKDRERRLARLLAPLADAYDLALLDCPPGISLLGENVIDAADLLLTPVIPTTLSMRTLEQLDGFLAHMGARVDVAPFFTMVDRRRRLHLDLVAQAPAQRPGFLRTVIPMSAEVERMGVERAPIVDFAPLSPAAVAFRTLWVEVAARLGVG